VERSKTFPRRSDAERWLAEVEVSRLRGTYVDPALGRTRLDAWARRWLDGVRPTLKPSTVDGYESLLRSRVLPTLGRIPLGELRPSDVQDWVATLEADGLSPSRIRKAHVVLAQILDAAMRDQLIARNAARGVKLPRIVRREAAYLEPPVVEMIAAAMPENYQLLVRLLGTIGPRFGEAAALTRSSYDPLRRRLRIRDSLTEVAGKLERTPTKTHAERSVPLPSTLATELTHHLAARVGTADNAPIFTSPTGKLLRHGAFYRRIWLPTLERLGLPRLGLHVLRHSAAARMISAGATPKSVQAVLGHSSAAFTLTVYGHVFDADLDGLARRLDELAENFSRPVRGLGPTDTAPAPSPNGA